MKEELKMLHDTVRKQIKENGVVEIVEDDNAKFDPICECDRQRKKDLSAWVLRRKYRG